MDIADGSNGNASLGEANAALGQPGVNGIVSLGDGGEAILTFEQPISNGPGPDFAIFENSFSDFFLELAFVEVSSDSHTWVRFPAHCLLSQTQQIGPFDDNSDPAKLNNLAGKYRGQYGTPFDLDELKDSVGINIDSIVFIKVIDCIGSLNPQYATYDTAGNAINDPYPTPFASSGFDLDAVGVIHQNVVDIQTPSPSIESLCFPNPVAKGQVLNFGYLASSTMVYIYNSTGKKVMQLNRPREWVIHLPAGVYFVKSGASIQRLSIR